MKVYFRQSNSTACLGYVDGGYTVLTALGASGNFPVADCSSQTCPAQVLTAAYGSYAPGPPGSSSSGTVTLVLPDMTADQVSDYMQLWALFLGLGVVVLCLKAIYSRFRLSKYEG